jgi:uncharacterized protein involved in exopolysaccharide biosynthesis
MALTVTITMLTPEEFRSTGKLFVRLGRENATLDPTVTLGASPTVAIPQSRDNEINSVVEILQSRTLLEKVVDGVGVDVVLHGGFAASAPAPSEPPEAIEASSSPIMGQFAALMLEGRRVWSSTARLDDRQRAILQLAKNLKVEAARKSNVIEVSYEGSTPEQCQAVVAQLIDAYLDEHLRLNRPRGSHEFFAEQTRRLREELSRREGELRDLKNATGLASAAAQRQVLIARIGHLEDDLLAAETARSVAEAKVTVLHDKLASLPDTQVTLETEGFGNEGTDRMRDQYYALQVREKEAAAKYTDDHPRMRALHEQSTASRALLNAEERGRKQVTREPGRLHQQAESALLAEEPTIASLRAKAEQLKTQLAAARREVTALNDNELRLAVMQRDIDLIEADYRKYSNNLEQARIDQQLETQRMSNIAIVQPASYEPRPIRPRKAVNLLLGLCVGVLGGLALPWAFDQSRVVPEGVERLNGSPPVTRMPRVSRLPARPLVRPERKVPR